MYQEILEKQKKIAVIGLGYVGLPIALAFAKKAKVIGFDINATRIELLKNQQDPSGELEQGEFENTDILFTTHLEDLKEANFYIVAVPTPIDSSKTPNLNPLLAASKTVGQVLKKGDIVVYESTVYPGCTEEDCVPILEQESKLLFQQDFKVGYSPERINPGDKKHTLATIVKVVASSCETSLETVAKVYEMVVEAGVYKASSIKVAEAAKVIENTQRDLNIALMNELSMIFDKMGINTFDVLDAAGTKWNFLKFTPGLVGGHCIGVDPYYLTFKAQKLGHTPHVILSGRSLNDSMGKKIASNTVKLVLKNGLHLGSPVKILLMGVTFKENVKDIRNSKVADIVQELKDFNVHLDIVDPHADPEELEEEYGFTLTKIEPGYDAVIVAVNHQEYLNLDETYFKSISKEKAVLVDVKGIYRGKIQELMYWSL